MSDMNLKPYPNMLTLVDIRCVVGLIILTLYICISDAATTRVVTTLPIPTAEEHGVFSIHCQVWNLAADHEVTMFRRVAGRIQRLSMGEGISEGVSERVFLAVRQLVDGSKIYFLTFMEASRDDRGEYHCKVVDIAATQQNLPSDSVTIEIEYFPSDLEPECAASTGQLVVNAGQDIELNCSSQVGNPPVDVEWTRAGTDKLLPSTKFVRDGVSVALLRLRPSQRDDKAVYICRISSEHFPDETKTCHIGPLTVVGRTQPSNEVDAGYVYPTDSPASNTLATAIHRNKTSIGSVDKCKSVCENTDVFYWVVTTIIAGFIALMFLIISVILLIKFHSAQSNNATEQYMPGLRHQPPREEIYTELEGRIAGENVVLMKLQKQTAPDQLTLQR